MRVALKFAYNGKNYHGFARQPNFATIEGTIIKSFEKNCIINDIKKSKIRYASRTDKGVSALGNIIVFNSDLIKNQNFYKLSKDFSDIIFYGFKKVQLDYNPRHAIRRIYRYHLPKFNIDYEKLSSIATIFIGRHDFSNYARVELFRNPIRTIDNIIVSENKNFINIDFYAQTFLWHQIRRIVSAIIKVEKGKLKLDSIINALNKPNISVDFGLAPAEPLILKDIIYNFEFKYNKKELTEINKLKLSILNNIKYLHF